MNISLRPLIPFVGVAMLAGCNSAHLPETPEVASQGIPPAIKVAVSEQHHTVYVTADRGTITEQEKLSLATFLSDVGASSTDGVHVVIRGAVAPAQLAPIARAVVNAGVEPTKIEVMPVAATGAPPSHAKGMQVAVEVIASSYAAEPPSCPRLSQLEILGSDNPPNSSDYGCSSVTNLEAMISDPRDLVRGESGGTVDAQMTNQAIKRYRARQTDQLKTESSQSTGANNSNTGNTGDTGTGGGGGQ